MGNRIAIDIGSVYVEAAIFLDGPPVFSEKHLFSEELNGTVYLVRYLKASFIDFKETDLFKAIPQDDSPVLVTGTKVDNFYLKVQEAFNIRIETIETTQCTIRTLDYLWNKYKDLFFYFANAQPVILDGILRVSEEYFTRTPFTSEEFYPYLLVNIRTGISIYRVDSPTNFKRVGGSSLGISTLFALTKMLCSTSNPIDLLEQSLLGNHTLVDLTVRDIYGDNCEKLGLPGDLIACSCGKLNRKEEFSILDEGKSLICLFLFNLSQISFMQSIVEGVDRIVMAGNTPNDPRTNMMLQFCMNYWSGGKMHPIFVDLEPYIRCFGSLLKNLV